MATTPANSWADKTAVKKGALGEGIIKAFLKERGWIVYQAVTEGGHCFDFLATKDKKELRVIEVKTKARRKHYPDMLPVRDQILASAVER